MVKYNSPAMKSVRKTDGSITAAAEEYDERWVEFFTQLFKARNVDSLADLFKEEEEESTSHVQEVDSTSYLPPPPVEKLIAAMNALPLNKGLGTDGVSAELMRAGGEPFVAKFYEILKHVWTSARFPIMWRGGRLKELLKKGTSLECDNHRGLLISDHMCKAATLVLDEYVHEYYYKCIPPEQCGAAVGRGIDLVTHVIRSAVDYAMLRNLSIAILFIDQVRPLII